MKTYKVYETDINDDDIAAVYDCVKSGWVSWRGKYVKEFEDKFAEYHAVKYAQTVSSGTTGLHLALLGLDIKSGDEVIIPDLAYIAAANAIKIVGAKPIFIDSNLDDWNMDINQIESAITERTKAIMVVHTLGAPIDMYRVMQIADKHNLLVIEDTCEALGARLPDGRLVGTFGHIGVFSFFANKTITTGEGGMIITNSKSLHEEIYKLKTQAVDPNKIYWHAEVGYNYRMTNLAAALGVSQLRRLDQLISAKIIIASWYRQLLPNLCFQAYSGKHSQWMIAINFNKDVGMIAAKLLELGVETRPMFYPATVMPVFHDAQGDIARPNSRLLSRQCLMLPSYPGLSDLDVKEITTRITEAIK
jgi:perosamine synthetase